MLPLTNVLCAHQYHNNAFTEAEVALLPLTVAPAAAEQSTLSQVRRKLLPIVVVVHRFNADTRCGIATHKFANSEQCLSTKCLRIQQYCKS
jgi:hypothetical protein